MPVKYQKWITREDCNKNPDVIYLFGDNVARRGFGGQAKEMRGCPNAIGIATKWYPSMESKAFFTDGDFVEVVEIWIDDFKPVSDALHEKRLVVIPSDGLGTGLSKLGEHSPRLKNLLSNIIKRMEEI